jgi:hypothetical protein
MRLRVTPTITAATAKITAPRAAKRMAEARLAMLCPSPTVADQLELGRFGALTQASCHGIIKAAPKFRRNGLGGAACR